MLNRDKIPGYAEFVDWCGGWPSFHDSEVPTIELNRKGISRLIIHVIGGPKPAIGPRADGRYASPFTDVIITFVLEGIDDLELAGFSSQNVIFDLRVEERMDMFHIFMDPCFGMAGKISAEKLSITFAALEAT